MHRGGIICATRPSPRPGRTSKAHRPLHDPAGISCENWTVRARLRHRRRRPPWHAPWPRALRAAGIDVEGPLGRGAPTPPAPTSCCCACPTARSRPRRRRPARARSSATARARRASTSLGDREAFSLHPLMTVPDGRGARGFAGAGCAVGGHHAARAAHRRRARRSALGMRAVAGRRRGPRRLPRRRLDRRRTSSSTLEAAAERLAATAGVDRELLVAARPRRRSTTGPRSGAERALTGPIARGDEDDRRAPARGGRRSARPSCSPLFDALVEADTRGSGPGAGMRTIRTVAELRAPPRDARAAGRTVGLVPTMGALPRRPPLADARRPRRRSDVVVVSLFVNPAQFNDARRPRRLPARRGAATPPMAAELGVDVLFAPAPSEVYPAGFATTVHVEGLTEVLEGAERGPEPLRRRLHRRREAAQHRRARRRLLRPEGRAAGRRRAPHGRATSTSRSGSRSCPTVREPDGLALSSRNVRLDAARPRARARRSRRALRRRRRRRSPPASATPPASRAVAAAHWGASSPSTSRSSTPRRFHGSRRRRPRARRGRRAASAPPA